MADMLSFRAYYSLGDGARYAMTVLAPNADAACDAVHKKLHKLTGKGVWKYELFPVNGSVVGECNTNKYGED